MRHDITIEQHLTGDTSLTCTCGWTATASAADVTRVTLDHQQRAAAEERLAGEMADPARRTEL